MQDGISVAQGGVTQVRFQEEKIMKNAFQMWALMALIPMAALAQSSLDEEVNAELDRLYQSSNIQPTQPQLQRSSGPAVQVNVQAQPAVTTTQTNNQGAAQTASPVQAVDQYQVQAQAQKQPTTIIEASPLNQSKADLIRKNRQDAELSTEEKIVEKLELSRLEDEKRRAEVLFGDKFNTLVNQQQSQTVQTPDGTVVQQQQQQTAVVPVVPVIVPEQTVTPAPVVVAAPAPTVAPTPAVVPAPAPVAEDSSKEEELDREAIRGEVGAYLAEFKNEEEKPKSKSYFSVMAGSGDYPDAVNVKGQYSLGVAFGQKFNDRFVAEGSFLYSSYQVEQKLQPGQGACYYDQYGMYTCYPRITEMNQYSTSILAKYQVLRGMLRPEVGGLVSYTYRTFSDKQFAITDAVLSSQALDFGVMTGASLELSESFSLGLDFRYMWNLTNRVDGNTMQKSSLYQGYSSDTPIEQLSYYNMSVVGRATF